MFLAGIKALFVLSAAWGASADISGVDDGLDLVDYDAVMPRRLANATDCKQSNDFMYDKCNGQGTAFLCCTPDETCVVVDVKSGTTTVKSNVCTKDRKLKGMRAVRVIVLPLFVLVAGFSALAIMLKFFGAKRPITLITVAIIGISWPLAISQLYAFYLWAAFLSFLVAFACSGMVVQKVALPSNTALVFAGNAPWYAFRILWLLEIFQVIAIFGGYETFHVPLWKNSGATAANMLGDTRFDQSVCATFYQNYFKVLALEKTAINANPIAQYWGLCTMEWLAFVHCTVIFQGLIWMGAVVRTAPMLLSDLNFEKVFGPGKAKEADV